MFYANDAESTMAPLSRFMHMLLARSKYTMLDCPLFLPLPFKTPWALGYIIIRWHILNSFDHFNIPYWFLVRQTHIRIQIHVILMKRGLEWSLGLVWNMKIFIDLRENWIVSDRITMFQTYLVNGTKCSVGRQSRRASTIIKCHVFNSFVHFNLAFWLRWGKPTF